MSELSAAFAQKSRIAEWTLGIFCCVMAVYNLFFSTPYYVFLSVLGLALVFVPRIAEWVLHLQKDYLLRLISYLYLFLVYGIGMIFNGYDRIPLYDKVMHTLTGVLVRADCLLLLKTEAGRKNRGLQGGILAGGGLFRGDCSHHCHRLGNRGICA